MTPTIVLVHGAFADSTSWAGLLDRLPADEVATMVVEAARATLASRS